MCLLEWPELPLSLRAKVDGSRYLLKTAQVPRYRRGEAGRCGSVLDIAPPDGPGSASGPAPEFIGSWFRPVPSALRVFPFDGPVSSRQRLGGSNPFTGRPFLPEQPPQRLLRVAFDGQPLRVGAGFLAVVCHGC